MPATPGPLHHVVAVRGPVVDVRGSPLPRLGHVLHVRVDGTTLMLVAAQHVSEDTARTIALQSTEDWRAACPRWTPARR